MCIKHPPEAEPAPPEARIPLHRDRQHSGPCCFTTGHAEGQNLPRVSVLFQTWLLLTHLHTAPLTAVGCSEVKEALNMERKGLSSALLPLRGTSLLLGMPQIHPPEKRGILVVKPRAGSPPPAWPSEGEAVSCQRAALGVLWGEMCS